MAADSAASDESLLAQVAEGDARAFAVLSERHLDRIHALAWRLTGNAADAEDVAQEVFVRLWTKAPDWRPGAARLSTWLYRVAFNLSIDWQRRSRRQAERPLDDAAVLEDPAPGAEETLAAKGRDRAVETAIHGLPERQRAAILLTYAEGFSNAEVAEILETSVKSVESLLVRARRELQSRLAGVEIAP